MQTVAKLIGLQLSRQWPKKTAVGSAKVESDSPKPNPESVENDCLRASLLFDPIKLVSRNAHMVRKRLETVCLKTLDHPICDIIDCGYFLEADFP